MRMLLCKSAYLHRVREFFEAFPSRRGAMGKAAARMVSDPIMFHSRIVLTLALVVSM